MSSSSDINPHTALNAVASVKVAVCTGISYSFPTRVIGMEMFLGGTCMSRAALVLSVGRLML